MGLTPMMLQYLETKKKCKGCILFFRLGDFYEMFFEDAKLASKELELVLTGRDCGLENKAPMCGIPYHAAPTYIGRLVSKGYKVAICEQLEDPAYSPTTFFVRKETKRRASRLLEDQEAGKDLSDLVEELLSEWLVKHSNV